MVAAVFITLWIVNLYLQCIKGYGTWQRRRYVRCVRCVELSVRNRQYFVTVFVQFVPSQRIAYSAHYNSCSYFVLSHRHDSCWFLFAALFNSPELWASIVQCPCRCRLLMPSSCVARRHGSAGMDTSIQVFVQNFADPRYEDFRIGCKVTWWRDYVVVHWSNQVVLCFQNVVRFYGTGVALI